MRKKSLTFLILVIVMIASLAAALIACDPDDPAADDTSYSTTLIANGNFDEAFLQLYPHFVDDFNTLLRPDARFVLPAGKLSIELRIYALMRLGVTNMGQVASFLHCSTQTVYNYKSKLKKMSDLDGDDFDERVKKIGTFSPVSVKEHSNDSTL